MNTTTRVLASSLVTFVAFTSPAVAKDTPGQEAAQEKIRAAIPLGGNFDPSSEEGIFVAAGHGLNVVASRDDGKTWKQVFYGGPGGDHGPWAVWNSVAYTQGVFAIAAGWGAPGTVIASEDGQNWRHLTDANRKPLRIGGKPYDMSTTMELIAVGGSFIMPLEATPDFGKTWFRSSAYGFTDASGNRVKVDLGHPSLACGKHGDKLRTIVIGDSGPAVYSDDLGKTWAPMQVKAQPWDPALGAKGIIAKGDVFLIVKGQGQNVLRSVDGGMTWTAHPLGVTRPEGRSAGLSIVNDEFWVTGKTSKASQDGITWRDLPADMPSGRVATSDKGTLINVNRGRTSILRSADGGKSWQEVYKFTPRGSGGAQGFADVEFGLVREGYQTLNDLTALYRPRTAKFRQRRNRFQNQGPKAMRSAISGMSIPWPGFGRVTARAGSSIPRSHLDPNKNRGQSEKVIRGIKGLIWRQNEAESTHRLDIIDHK